MSTKVHKGNCVFTVLLVSSVIGSAAALCCMPPLLICNNGVLTWQGEYFIKIILPVIASVIAFFSLWLLIVRSYATQKQAEISAETLKLSREQVSETIFNNAIQNLGNEQEVVILGGIYALHRLACEQPKQYASQIVDIFCSIIREKTINPLYKLERECEYEDISSPDVPDYTPRPISKNVIQTLINKLFLETENMPYRQFYKELSGSDLRKIEWDETILEKVNFCATDFRNVSLYAKTITNVNFSQASLDDTDFRGQNLSQSVSFNYARLENANLQNCDLRGTYLRNTSMLGVNLQGAIFDETTQLEKADLRGSQSDGVLGQIHLGCAVVNHTEIVTMLEGIKIFQNNTELKEWDNNRKKDWFRAKEANVDDISIEDVSTCKNFTDLRNTFANRKITSILANIPVPLRQYTNSVQPVNQGELQ